MPTAAERTGDFSASDTLPVDPATGQTFACNGVTGVICPNRLDPVAMKIINTYIPLSNVPGNIWQGYVPSPYDTDEVLLKIDHQLNTAHRLDGTYFLTTGSNTVRAGTGNLPWASQKFKWRQHNVNLSDTWVVSTNTINQAWFSFNRNFGGRLNLPATSLTDLGSSAIIQGAPSLPQITVSGFFTLTNAIGGPKAGGDFYSVRDVFSWTIGAHAVKLGGELSYNKTVQDTLLNNYGVFTFNNSVTRNALADFLIGIPSAVTQDAPVTALWNSWYGAAFLQDDYRLNARMTLNLGLRWDVQTPGTDPQNRFTTYVPGQKSTVRPDAPAGQLFYGDPGVERGVIPTSWSHVSPRVGFVWDPFGDGKTSVRAAGGIFYGSISGNEWNTMTNFQPWSTRLTFTNINPRTSATGVPLGASLSNPYNAFVGGAPFPYNGSYATGGSIFGVSQDFEWARAYQTNVGVQRQIGKSLAVGAAYVGTFNRNLPFGRDVNYPVVTPTATAAGANILSRRPNPAFGAVLLLDSDQTSDYNGLQVTATMRPWHHVSFNGFYTLSKTMTSAQLHNNTTQGLAQNYSNLAEDFGRADTDQRHVFSMSVNWEIDYYRGKNAVLRHVRQRLEPGADHQAAQRPAVHGHQRQRRRQPRRQHERPRAADRRSRTSTTRRPRSGSIRRRSFRTRSSRASPPTATRPRNLLDGPGYRVVDLALSRDFQLPGRVEADVPRRGHQRLQHRQPRTAGQRRAVGRDIHDLRRDPHGQRHAQDAVGIAADVLNPRDHAEHAIVALPQSACGHAGHEPGNQPADCAESHSHQSADLAGRPREAHGHSARRRQPAGQRVDPAWGGVRGRDGRGEARAQADVPLYRLAQAVRGRHRHPADAHLHDGDRPGWPPARQRDQLPDRARAEAVRRRVSPNASRPCSPRARTSAAARASASWCPAWWKRTPAGCCGRPTWGGAISACAIRSRRPSACRSRSRTPGRRARSRSSGRHAGAQAPSNFVYISVSDGLGVGIVVGRRVRARPAQHRRRIRSRPVERRWPALRVRRLRMLGSVCLESRHPLTVFRAGRRRSSDVA